jgi:hypothetical protein
MRHLEAAVYHGKRARAASRTRFGADGEGELVAEARIAEELLCSITNALMRDPVVVSSGHTFERRAIQEWMNTKMRKGLPATCPNTNVEITGDLITNVKMRSLTLGFADVYRNSPSQSVRDMITAFDADAGGVEPMRAVEPADAADALAPDYWDMVGRYKYFELHAPTLSGAIEKFANPVNGNSEVHNQTRDMDRYASFYREAKYYGVRVEVRSAVPHEALPPLSVMLELYEKFAIHTREVGRIFDRSYIFTPDGRGGETFSESEFNLWRGRYDRLAGNGGYLSEFTPRSALPGTGPAKRPRSD